MVEQIPLVECPVLVVKRPAPAATTLWMVAAYRPLKDWPYWRVFPGNYASRERAEEEALALPACWSHARIIAVTLGGEEV